MTAVCGVGVVSLALTFARSGANEVGLDKAWRIDIRGAGLYACWSQLGTVRRLVTYGREV